MARQSVEQGQRKVGDIVLESMTRMCEVMLLQRLPEFDLQTLEDHDKPSRQRVRAA